MDFAYSPPLGNANDAMNMAAYVAENRISGFSPTMTIHEIDTYLDGKAAQWIDVRDIFTFKKSHIEGAINIPLEILPASLEKLDKDQLIFVYDKTGKKGHQALRILVGAGFNNVFNVSGGMLSLTNYARAITPLNFVLNLPDPEQKKLGETNTVAKDDASKEAPKKEVSTGPLVIDVRTIFIWCRPWCNQYST